MTQESAPTSPIQAALEANLADARQATINSGGYGTHTNEANGRFTEFMGIGAAITEPSLQLSTFPDRSTRLVSMWRDGSSVFDLSVGHNPNPSEGVPEDTGRMRITTTKEDGSVVKREITQPRLVKMAAVGIAKQIADRARQEKTERRTAA